MSMIMCRFSGVMKRDSRRSCDGDWDSRSCVHLTASNPDELQIIASTLVEIIEEPSIPER